MVRDAPLARPADVVAAMVAAARETAAMWLQWEFRPPASVGSSVLTGPMLTGAVLTGADSWCVFLPWKLELPRNGAVRYSATGGECYCVAYVRFGREGGRCLLAGRFGGC